MPSLRFPFVVFVVFGALLTGAAPANDPRPDAAEQLETAAAQLDEIEDLALQVWDPTLRRELFEHVRAAEMAVHRARYELEYGGWDRDHGRPSASLSFDDARSVVMRESFDSGRLEAIQRVARNGRFTTEQAAALAEMCTFDSYRKEALIALYPAVVDPGRYLLALDVLDFDSSKRAVESALGL